VSTAGRIGEQRAQVGDIELCYETFGDRSRPALLLVMGLNSQMVLWEDDFCERLADRGFWVTRFDNRDCGHSTVLRDAPIPTRMQLLLRQPRGATYALEDMASDAAGLLDELGIEHAHIVGASMGGMIAQLIAIRYRERVRSLVSIMSTTGNRRVGRPTPRVYPLLVRRVPRDREGYILDFIAAWKTIGSPRYHDPARLRALAERCYDRGTHPAGSARQLAAIVTAKDRTEELKQLSVPTTVIHGEIDPLVNPSGGRATAAAIPAARLVMIPDMGHDLPRELWNQFLDEIEATTARQLIADRRGAASNST
jgi:pimeloyl-ACP methyl ester carboxylesterase